MANYETEFLKALSMATSATSGLMRSIREPDYEEKLAMQTERKKELMTKQQEFDMTKMQFMEDSRNIDRQLDAAKYYDGLNFQAIENGLNRGLRIELQKQNLEWNANEAQKHRDWSTAMQEDMQDDDKKKMILDNELKVGSALTILGAQTDADIRKMLLNYDLTTSSKKQILKFADDLRDGNVKEDMLLSLEQYKALTPLVTKRQSELAVIGLQDFKDKYEFAEDKDFGDWMGNLTRDWIGDEGNLYTRARINRNIDSMYFDENTIPQDQTMYDISLGRRFVETEMFDNVSDEQKATTANVATNLMNLYGAEGMDLTNPDVFNAMYQNVKFQGKAAAAELMNYDVNFDDVTGAPWFPNMRGQETHKEYLTKNKNIFNQMTGILGIQAEQLIHRSLKGLSVDNKDEVMGDIKSAIKHLQDLQVSAKKAKDDNLYDAFVSQENYFSNYLELMGETDD